MRKVRRGVTEEKQSKHAYFCSSSILQRKKGGTTCRAGLIIKMRCLPLAVDFEHPERMANNNAWERTESKKDKMAAAALGQLMPELLFFSLVLF